MKPVFQKENKYNFQMAIAAINTNFSIYITELFEVSDTLKFSFNKAVSNYVPLFTTFLVLSAETCHILTYVSTVSIVFTLRACS